MKAATFLYNILIRAYSSAVKIASPFHPKAKKLAKGQHNLLADVEKQLSRVNAPLVWFHCASLGEFEQGRPVMEAFKIQYPDFKILLTFFSPSGYEVRKNYSGADFIFYLPFDTPENATRFVKAAKPRLAFFIKYEFWYNYLYQLHRQKVPTILISGIFRPEQLFFRKSGGFYRQMLHFFNHLFLQNEESVQLLQKIGVQAVSLSGDTRFDRVAATCQNPQRIPLAEAFKDQAPLLVVGSSWQPDIQVLTPLLQQFKGKLKTIIAPHEVDEAHLQETEKLLQGLKVERYSQSDDAKVTEADVLLIDNVGMLSALYALGDFAYVGGSFGKGLHNILEAATFGMPVFFGNKGYHKFQEAKDLVKSGGAFAVGSAAELQQAFGVLYKEEEKRMRAAEICATYVQQQTGATEQIMEYVGTLMKEQYARKNF